MILDKIFLSLKQKAIENFPELRDTHIYYSKDADETHAEGYRNFAYTAPNDLDTIYICKALDNQSPERIRGILAHEFGHLIDNLVPLRSMDSEARADMLAKRYLGVEIQYDEDDVEYAVEKYTRGGLGRKF